MRDRDCVAVWVQLDRECQARVSRCVSMSAVVGSGTGRPDAKTAFAEGRSLAISLSLYSAIRIRSVMNITRCGIRMSRALITDHPTRSSRLERRLPPVALKVAAPRTTNPPTSARNGHTLAHAGPPCIVKARRTPFATIPADQTTRKDRYPGAERRLSASCVRPSSSFDIILDSRSPETARVHGERSVPSQKKHRPNRLGTVRHAPMRSIKRPATVRRCSGQGSSR